MINTYVKKVTIQDLIFLDFETCGLHGPAVKLQYGVGDSSPQAYDIWKIPIKEVITHFDLLVNSNICAFNLVFDWFHLVKMYSTVEYMLSNYKVDTSKTLLDYLEQYKLSESPARAASNCYKPKSAFDLMLYIKKGPLQATMDRKPFKIRRIPKLLAEKLVFILDERIKFDSIYFANKKTDERWKIVELEDDKEFVNIELNFKASSALKNVVKYLLGYKETLKIELDKDRYPFEVGYAPFYQDVSRNVLKALPKRKKKNQHYHQWPIVIKDHITYWEKNELANQYAIDDITYMQELFNYFAKDGKLEVNDDDSILTIVVANTRWKGFSVDTDKLAQMKASNDKLIASTPIAPAAARKYIHEKLNPMFVQLFGKSTKKQILQELAKLDDEGGKRAKEVLLARRAKKLNEMIDKLLYAGRFHPSLKIIGALSGRMSGADELNPQGIPKEKSFRKMFTMADSEEEMDAGDFDAFEVAIAEADFNDPELRAELLSGKKIHGIFGTFLYPPNTYEQIVASSGKDPDLYTLSKSGVFAMIYGGNAMTLKNKLNVELEQAERAFAMFSHRYPGVGRARNKIFQDYAALKQAGAIGTKITYSQPKDSIESMLGFNRFFHLENKVIKLLFELANKPPEELKGMTFKVQRRDRIQTATGAVQSALYGCAFAIQSSNMRAASNHRIQSTGAQLTKNLQVRLWDVQPQGKHKFYIRLVNIHDELIAVRTGSVKKKVKDIVDDTVKNVYSKLVPMVEMTWNQVLNNWSEK